MSHEIPAWASAAVWYSVYPLGACGAPIRAADSPGPHHRLRRLLGWLDHIVALGANGLALGPLWASSTHGYDIIDHDVIDARLVDDHDFDDLGAACHERGLRVLLDGVFNHVSAQHPDVCAAIAQGPDSPAGRLFRHDPAQADGLARFEGHSSLVEYDHDNPAVIDRVVATMTHWLGRGADGWRLDAAYRVAPPFWAQVMAQVQTDFPQALTVGEILHGDYAAIAAAACIDSVTQYELWKAIWSSLKDRNPHELVWALQRHATALDARPGCFLPWTFVGNHDVTRIASQVGPHDALVATALLSTLPGMSAIYYGDEFGFTGIKEERLGGDDAVRPALPDDPSALLQPEAGQPDQTDPAWGDPAAWAETLRQHQLLLGLRRRHPWLQWAGLTITDQPYQRLAYRLTPGPGAGGSAGSSPWLAVTLDTASQPSRLTISDQSGLLYSL